MLELGSLRNCRRFISKRRPFFPFNLAIPHVRSEKIFPTFTRDPFFPITFARQDKSSSFPLKSNRTFCLYSRGKGNILLASAFFFSPRNFKAAPKYSCIFSQRAKYAGTSFICYRPLWCEPTKFSWRSFLQGAPRIGLRMQTVKLVPPLCEIYNPDWVKLFTYIFATYFVCIFYIRRRCLNELCLKLFLQVLLFQGVSFRALIII